MPNEGRLQIGERLKQGGALLGVTLMVGALTIGACGGDDNESAQGNDTDTTLDQENTTNPDGTTDTSAEGIVDPNGDPMLPGTITPGNDETVRVEDDAGLYECGGVKGEDWENTPFTPDRGLIPHMNAHEDLAESDYDSWTDVMSEEGFNLLTERAFPNANHDETIEVDIEGVPDSYDDFLARQISTPMQSTIVTQNHACLDSEGNYRVFPVGMKQLTEGDTNITGLVLNTDDFDDFRATVNENGGDMDRLIIQELDNVDTDGDGEGDTDLVHVGTKHEECGNNELEVPPEDVPPAVPTIPEDEATTTTASTPDTTVVVTTSTVPTTLGTTTTRPVTTTTRPATTTTTGPAPTTTTTTRPPTPSTTKPPIICDPEIDVC